MDKGNLLVKVKVLKDFKGSNHGWDSIEYKEGDIVDITTSLYDSCKEVRKVDKKGASLPVEHWVEKAKEEKKIKTSEK